MTFKLQQYVIYSLYFQLETVSTTLWTGNGTNRCYRDRPQQRVSPFYGPHVHHNVSNNTITPLECVDKEIERRYTHTIHKHKQTQQSTFLPQQVFLEVTSPSPSFFFLFFFSLSLWTFTQWVAHIHLSLQTLTTTPLTFTFNLSRNIAAQHRRRQW